MPFHHAPISAAKFTRNMDARALINSARLNPAGLVKFVADIGCSSIPNAQVRAACELVARELTGGGGNGGGGGGGGGGGSNLGTPTPDCFLGQVWDPNLRKCVFGLGQKVGPDDQVGPAIMGRYGAAYQPANRVINRSVCLPGDVVANDGLCYSKSSVTNRERQWPRGRRPLLTGGEMRAISIAARAGKKFERTQKRLQSLGMVKKPARRAAPKMIAPPAHHHHD